MMRKTQQLKNLIRSSSLEFLMEAHNGVSGRIVEEAGFKGIWASGLTISASLGVRDNNEASWTQVLEVVEFMSDSTNIPILLDGDTGYGNFNNVRRLVKKLEQRDVAGVCIEDKLFPKTNSFIAGEKQQLADINEFCGKIKAAKDTHLDSDFCVVARTEAFIAGLGTEEALRRAEAYREAGADAILVHSKRSDSKEIDAFMASWPRLLPIIIVPTKYYSTPTDKLRRMGLSIVIWANHSLRAAVSEMQRITNKIYHEQSLISVEDSIATVSELFRLQGADELKEAEKRYLPASGKNVNAVVLAAGQGNLGEISSEIPKTLVRIGDKSILVHQIDAYHKMGVRDITVVRGFGKEMIVHPAIAVIDNDSYATTCDLFSLYMARDTFRANTIICYGDVVFRGFILHELMSDENDITIVADVDVSRSKGTGDYVKTSKPFSDDLYTTSVPLLRIATSSADGEWDGEFIGLWKMNVRGIESVLEILDRMATRADFAQLTIVDLLSEVNAVCNIAVLFIRGSWLNVNSIVDLQHVENVT